MKVVLLPRLLTLSDSASIATYVRPPVVTLSGANEYVAVVIKIFVLNDWKAEVPGHPTRSNEVRGPQNPPGYPTRLSVKVLISFIFTVPFFYKYNSKKIVA